MKDKKLHETRMEGKKKKCGWKRRAEYTFIHVDLINKKDGKERCKDNKLLYQGEIVSYSDDTHFVQTITAEQVKRSNFLCIITCMLSHTH